MTDDPTPPPRPDPPEPGYTGTGHDVWEGFHGEPSRHAPQHDRPTPIVEPDEIGRLKVIVEHWRRVMRSPSREPEYVEAVARLRELEAVPPPMTEKRQGAMDRMKIASLQAQIASHRRQIIELEIDVAGLTDQRDAAVAACRAVMADGITWVTFPLLQDAIALCSPAPVERQGEQPRADTKPSQPSWMDTTEDYPG